MSSDWTIVAPKLRSVETTQQQSPLSKQARKNQRRKQARRAKTVASPAETGQDDMEDTAINRAMEESLVTLQNEHQEPDDPSIRAARLRKKLRSIAHLEARAMDTGLSQQEQAKLLRKPDLEAQLAEIVAEIDANEAAAVAASEQAKQALISVTLVQFDADRFGCPICTEVMDAATTMLPCQHTFCRECIEVALAKTVQPGMSYTERVNAVVCPLCRTPLFNQKQQKVLTKPALKLRKKIAKAVGTCHCGLEMPLSALREHLRQCGPGASLGLYSERKQYKNEFEQPPVIVRSDRSGVRDGWQFTPRGYDEDQALQAALTESLQPASIE